MRYIICDVLQVLSVVCSVADERGRPQTQFWGVEYCPYIYIPAFIAYLELYFLVQTGQTQCVAPVYWLDSDLSYTEWHCITWHGKAWHALRGAAEIILTIHCGMCTTLNLFVG